MGAVVQQHSTTSALVDMEKSFTTSNTNVVEILLQAYKRCKWKEFCGGVLYSNCTLDEGAMNLALVRWDAKENDCFLRKKEHGIETGIPVRTRVGLAGHSVTSAPNPAPLGRKCPLLLLY